MTCSERPLGFSYTKRTFVVVTVTADSILALNGVSIGMIVHSVDGCDPSDDLIASSKCPFSIEFSYVMTVILLYLFSSPFLFFGLSLFSLSSSSVFLLLRSFFVFDLSSSSSFLPSRSFFFPSSILLRYFFFFIFLLLRSVFSIDLSSS